MATAAQSAQMGAMPTALTIGTIAGIVIAVLFLVVIPAVIAGKGRLSDGRPDLRAGVWALWRGQDGRVSTSKAQFFAWTFVVLWGYGLLYVVQMGIHHDYGALQTIRPSLLAAMGLSGLTMVTAKAITTSYVASGKVDKSIAPEVPSGGLFSDDNGQPDLGKIQLMAFTFIALAVFLIQLYANAVHGTCELPDIAMSLVVLMGIGHGTYLGKKLVTADTPRITGISPSYAPPSQVVTLMGSSLGDGASGQLTFDGEPLSANVVSWTDTRVVFSVPMTGPRGKSWPEPPDSISVGVVVNGMVSANEVSMFVPFPTIRTITPAKPKPGETVTIDGQMPGPSGKILLDGQVVGSWSNAGKPQFQMLHKKPNGDPFAPGDVAKLNLKSDEGLTCPADFPVTVAV